MKRFYAEEVNGKGYLFDREFSEKVPISVDHTYQQVEASAARFDEEERLNGSKNSEWRNKK